MTNICLQLDYNRQILKSPAAQKNMESSLFQYEKSMLPPYIRQEKAEKTIVEVIYV
nr:hypothetical protein [uncultured Acetatifactor sp.]